MSLVQIFFQSFLSFSLPLFSRLLVKYNYYLVSLFLIYFHSTTKKKRNPKIILLYMYVIYDV